MYPIFLVTFFGAIMMYYTAVETPMREAAIAATRSDVSATNFFAYRAAVQRYLQANPSATGTIQDASLATFWLPGYVRDPNWTNLVSGSALYVFSTMAVDHGTLNAIWNKSSENVLAGTKNPVTGRLLSFNGFDTGVVLPASIPNNAIVMMGR
jgi:hypothetical protein